MAPKGIFKGQVFCISGRLSQTKKDYEEQITKYGGVVVNSVTTAVTYLISNEDDVKAAPVKVAAAQGRGVPIVQEGFIGACIGAKKVLGAEFFAVKGSVKRKAAAKGKAPAPKKVKVVAAAAAGVVDGKALTTEKAVVLPRSGLADKAEVVITKVKGFGGDLTWDVEMVLNDPTAGKDRFYNLQLLASLPDRNTFYVVHNWGKTGMPGTMYVDGPHDSFEECRVAFKKKYRSKTGNTWGAVDKSFLEVPGKYKLLCKEKEEEVEEKKREGPGKWQYYLHNKVDGKKISWYDYDGEAAENMEKYWRQYNSNEGLGVRLVQSDYFKYEVNFTDMIQTNVKTGMRRVIRRLKAGEKPDPAAPAKIPDKVDPKPVDTGDDDDDDDDESEDEEEEVADEAAAPPAEPKAPGRKAPEAAMEVEKDKPASSGGRKAPPAEEAPASGGRKAPDDAAYAETEAGSPAPAPAGDDDETLPATMPVEIKKRG